MLDFTLFYFISYFHFIFNFGKLGLELNVTLHVTVTNSHSHIVTQLYDMKEDSRSVTNSRS